MTARTISSHTVLGIRKIKPPRETEPKLGSSLGVVEIVCRRQSSKRDSLANLNRTNIKSTSPDKHLINRVGSSKLGKGSQLAGPTLAMQQRGATIQEQDEQQDERLLCPAGGAVNIMNHFRSIETRPSGRQLESETSRSRSRRGGGGGAPSRVSSERLAQEAGARSPRDRPSMSYTMWPRRPVGSLHTAILMISLACLTRCALPVWGARSTSSWALESNRLATGEQQRLGGSSSNVTLSSRASLNRAANVELSRRSLQRAQRETPISLNSIETVPQQPASVVNANQPGAQQQQAPAQVPPPTCGYPGSPAHASVTFNTSHVLAGTAASYTCDNGYELLGPPRRICQANGSWSPVGIPFCGKYGYFKWPSVCLLGGGLSFLFPGHFGPKISA